MYGRFCGAEYFPGMEKGGGGIFGAAGMIIAIGWSAFSAFALGPAAWKRESVWLPFSAFVGGGRVLGGWGKNALAAFFRLG